MTLFALGVAPCDLELRRMSTMRSETTTEMRVDLHEKMRFTANARKKTGQDNTKNDGDKWRGETDVSRG